MNDRGPGAGKTESGTARNGDVELYYTIDRPGDQLGGQPGALAGTMPLLLINGLGSPLVAFEPGFVARLVGAGFTVARFDNRDTGRSSLVPPQPAGAEQGRAVLSPQSYTISDMAADAVAVLEAIGWDRAHVLGQSMGGIVAQRVAIEHPRRTASLIALMTRSGRKGSGDPTEAAMNALLLPAPEEREEWLAHRVETERVWASPDHWSEPWVRDKATAMLDHGVDRAGTFRQFRAIMAEGSRDELLQQLDLPCLVIHGSADTLIQPDGGRHLASVIPGARYVEVEGLGHDLPPAYWNELATLMTDFVAAL